MPACSHCVPAGVQVSGFAVFAIFSLVVGCKGKSAPSAATPTLRSAGAASVPIFVANPSTADEKTPRPRSKASRLVVGDNRACAILENRTVACWGQDNTLASWGRDGSSTPRVVAGLTDVVDVAISQGIVAVRSDGSVLVAAVDGRGPPRTLERLTGVTRVNGDFYSLCAIAAEGRVICYSNPPYEWHRGKEAAGLEVRGVRGATELGFGRDYACALVTGGEVKCWRMTSAVSPSKVLSAFTLRGVKDVSSLAMGSSAICVRHTDGSAACSSLKSSSKKIHDLGQVNALAMDQRGYYGDDGVPVVCAAHGKAISCQRFEDFGSDSSTKLPKAGPVPAGELGRIVELGVKGATACARDESGLVACWGSNAGGALARPDLCHVDRPMRVPGVPEATEVALGEKFSCALSVAGEVWCWGKKGKGGDAHCGEPHMERVAGLEHIHHIFAAWDYCCAETAGGEVHCFSGIEGPDRQRRPVRVPVFEGARSVALPQSGWDSWVAVASHDGELLLGKTPNPNTLEGLSLAPVRGVSGIRRLVGAYELVALDDAGRVFVDSIYAGKLSEKRERGSLNGALDVAYATALFAGGQIRSFMQSGPEDTSGVIRENSPIVSLLEGPEPCGRTASGNVMCFIGSKDEVLLEGMKSSAGSKHGHLCGVDAQGRVFCRGHNDTGQCGVSVGIDASEVPLTVPLP